LPAAIDWSSTTRCARCIGGAGARPVIPWAGRFDGGRARLKGAGGPTLPVASASCTTCAGGDTAIRWLSCGSADHASHVSGLHECITFCLRLWTGRRKGRRILHGARLLRVVSVTVAPQTQAPTLRRASGVRCPARRRRARSGCAPGTRAPDPSSPNARPPSRAPAAWTSPDSPARCS